MKKLIAPLPLILAMTCASAGDVYTEGKTAPLSGKVVMADAPAPLDESRHPKRVRFPALEIDQPFDLVSPDNSRVHSSRLVQLGASEEGQYERIKSKIGRTIKIRCNLEPATTAYHYTPVFCFVNDDNI